MTTSNEIDKKRQPLLVFYVDNGKAFRKGIHYEIAKSFIWHFIRAKTI